LYKQWEKDLTVSNVILRGTGQKAFCAGGDVVQVYHSGLQGGTIHKDFFEEEYKLDYLIGTLSSPHIALLDGVTMGGGVGLSVHGKFRVATENTVFAMPETGIGFFPDVGGSFFLPRLNGSLGTYLALTGQRLKGQDVVIAGVATHYVPSTALRALEEDLVHLKSRDSLAVDKTLNKFTQPTVPGQAKIIQERDLINRVFSLDSIEQIFDALHKEKSEFAVETLKLLELMSPTSLKISLRLMREGAKLNLAQCLVLEYAVSQTFMNGHDFYEGVRALLVDKDRKPKWEPKTINEVKDSSTQKYFEVSTSLELESHNGIKAHL